MALATVNNKINKNGTTLTQQMNLIEGGNKLLSFSTGAGDIFSIEKENQSYKLKFTEHGKSLLKIDSIEDITLSENSVSMLPRKQNGVTTIGQEIELNVDINGKSGKLTANAESVSFSDGTKLFSYDVASDQSLSINMTQEAINMSLGEGSLFANTPSTYDKSFPLPILKLTLSAAYNGANTEEHISVGNFKLHKFPGPRTPQLIVEEPSGELRILQGSDLHKCKSFVPVYDNSHFFCAIQASGLRGVPFHLETSGENTLSPSSKNAMELFSRLPMAQEPSASNNPIELATNTGSVKFESKDQIGLTRRNMIFNTTYNAASFAAANEAKAHHAAAVSNLPIPEGAPTISFVNITNTDVDLVQIFQYTLEILKLWDNPIYTTSDETRQSLALLINQTELLMQLIQDINAQSDQDEKEALIGNFNEGINEIYIRIDNLLRLDISEELKDYLNKLKLEIEKKKEQAISSSKESETEIAEEEAAEEASEESEEQENEENEAEEEASEEAEEKKAEPKEKEYKLKQNVERASKSLFALAFILAGGVLIPGLGALFAGLAVATMATAVLANVYAEKFNFKIYEMANKELSEAELEELEDVEAVEKFIQNEKDLDKLAENAHASKEELEKLIAEDGSSLKAIVDAYNTFGNGFHINPEDDLTRTEQLLGTDGHDIRHTMLYGDKNTQLGGLNAILESSTPQERQHNINEFIANNFSPDMPQSEKEAITNLLMADNENAPEMFDQVHKFVVGLNELDKQEVPLVKLLSTQKATLGSMRDDLIKRVISHSFVTSEDKFAPFVDQYSYTILKHCMLDDEISQEKLDYLLSGLSEEQKLLSINKLTAAADRLNEELENIASYTAESVLPKQQKARTTESYVGAVADLSSIASTAFSTLNELAEVTNEYLINQTARANLATINNTNSKIAAHRDSRSERTQQIIDSALAVTQSDIQSDCEALFKEAQDAGLANWHALQAVYTPGITRAMVTEETLPRNKTTVALIGEFLEVNDDKPEYEQLKNAYLKYQADKEELISQQENNFFEAMYSSTNSTVRATINKRLNQKTPAIVKPTKKKASPQYAEELQKYQSAWIKEYISTQAEPEKTDWSTAYEMISTGSLADVKLAEAENAALNVDMTNMDAKINKNAKTMLQKTKGARNLERVLLNLPSADREELRTTISNKIEQQRSAASSTSNFDPRQIVREELANKYGSLLIEQGSKTADELLTLTISNHYQALLENFPKEDRTELGQKISEILEQGIDIEQKIAEHLSTKYGNTLIKTDKLPIETPIYKVTNLLIKDQDLRLAPPIETLTAKQIFNTWLKLTITAETADVMKKVHKRSEQELSCCAGDLGKKFAEDVYVSYAAKQNPFAETDNSFASLSKKERRLHEEHAAEIETVKEEFNAAWEKATNSVSSLSELKNMILQPSGLGKKELAQWNARKTALVELGIDVESLEKMLSSDKVNTFELKLLNPHMSAADFINVETEFKNMEMTSDKFLTAWKEAADPSNPNLEKLATFIAKPTQQEVARKAQELAARDGLMPPTATTTEAVAEYNRNLDKYKDIILENWRKRSQTIESMGIDVKELQAVLSGYNTSKEKLADPTLTAEEKETLMASIQDKNKRASASIGILDRAFNIKQTAKEFLGRKREDLEDCRVMQNADTLHDLQHIRIVSDVRKTTNDIDNISAKYKAILSLKSKYGDVAVKSILHDFANGNLLNLANKRYPELRKINFSRNDVEAIERLGLTGEIVTLDSTIIEKHMAALLENQKIKLQALELQGRDARIDNTRTSDLSKAKRPKGLKYRLTKIRSMLKNIKTADEAKKILAENEAELHPEIVLAELETEAEDERDAS